ncbi:MAG: hypothetical protein JEZ08_15700 [Clostridiales bacterium]|nr:hypothetical protein [Clostridiales bacterium]
MKRLMILLMMLLLMGCSVKDEFDGGVKTFDSNENMDFSEVDVNETTYNDLVEMYGLADKYHYNDRIFDPNELPNLFYMTYGNGMSFTIRNNQILEMSVESEKVIYGEDLYVGQDLDEALTFLSEPAEIVSDIHLYGMKDVLYKNITDRGDGDSGYYHDTKKNIRIWTHDDKLTGIYYISQFETIYDHEEKVIGEGFGTSSYGSYNGNTRPYETDYNLKGKWTFLDFVVDMDHFEYGKKRSPVQFIDLHILRNGSIKNSSLVWTKGEIFNSYNPNREIYKYEIQTIDEREYLVLKPWVKDEGSGFYIFEREVN